jgi:hypothetical protein
MGLAMTGCILGIATPVCAAFCNNSEWACGIYTLFIDGGVFF